MGRLAGLSVGEGLPEICDRLGQAGYFIGQPLGVVLLCCEGAFDGLYVVLERLQLIDRFLLGLVERFGFLDELLGGLLGLGLEQSVSQDTILLRWVAGMGTP